jgi:cobalt/nickel transport system permease protein
MSKMVNALYNIRLLDSLSRKETFIHRVHPAAKLITTVIYLAVVVSFARSEVISLLPYVFYPVLIFSFAELPVVPILKRALLAAPLIIGIGILNPFFDQDSVLILGLAVSRGWLTFLSILIKGSLTVTASLLLIATTGIERLAAGMRSLKVPKILVLQLLLTYRYISVLIEELSRMLRAYFLRAPGQSGIKRDHWGSFTGQLILRTFDRAQRVYQAMMLRGFTGEYYPEDIAKVSFKDLIFLSGWSLFFIIGRIYSLPVVLGSLLTGVICR